MSALLILALVALATFMAALAVWALAHWQRVQLVRALSFKRGNGWPQQPNP